MGYQGAFVKKCTAQGFVLWVVLIFSLILSLITHCMLQTAWLQSKMASSYHAFRLAFREAEAELVELENRMKEEFHPILPTGVTWLQFIPDTLHFGENQGQNVYLVTKEIRKDDGTHVRLSSTLVVRKKTDTFIKGMIYARTNLVIYHLSNEGQIKHKIHWQTSDHARLWTPHFCATTEVFYVVSEQFILYVIDKWGNEISQVNLLQDLSLKQREDLFSTERFQELQLSLSDPIVDGEQRQWLAITMPLINNQIQIFDVTAKHAQPFKLTEMIFPEEVFVESIAFTKIDPHESLLVAAVVDQNHTAVSLFDIFSGAKRREWILPATLSGQLTVVDPLGLGYANRIYLGDKQGQLWRIDINDLRAKIVFRDQHCMMHWLGRPIVGRDPEGKGVLVYVVAVNALNQRVLCAVKDETAQNEDNDLLFMIDHYGLTSQPLLRQNRLIFLSKDAVYAYDAWTGEKLSEEKLSLEHVMSALNLPPTVIQAKPVEQEPHVIFFDDNQIHIGQINGETDKLGRRAWVE